MESNLKHLQDTGAHNARIIRVGSRKSQLALIQTDLVIKKLQEFYLNNQQDCHDIKLQTELSFKVVSMTTTGDRILDKPLPAIGTKALFTGELENELREGRVDFVVHSLKDLPTTLPEGLVIGAIMKRDDPDDTIVLKEGSQMNPLDLILGRDARLNSMKLKVGTSSQRRIAMIKKCNPNLKCVDIRGNLNTRLAKLDTKDGEYAAIILARAGLDRMGLSDRASFLLKPDSDAGLSDWCYAVGQGAIAVECRADDDYMLELLSSIVDLETTYEVIAERSLMKKLGAGCSMPLGVRSTWTQAENDKKILKLESIKLSSDGQCNVKADASLVLPSLNKIRDTATNTEGLELSTTGIILSKSRLTYLDIKENLVKCSDLGVDVANKMHDLGCNDIPD